MGIEIAIFFQQVLKPLDPFHASGYCAHKPLLTQKERNKQKRKKKNRFLFFFIVYLPVPLEKFTTRPRAFFTNGRKVLVTSIIPQRLTSAVRLKVFSGVHSMGSVLRIPALFTRPHNPVFVKNKRKQQRKSANVLTKAIDFDCSQKVYFAIH